MKDPMSIFFFIIIIALTFNAGKSYQYHQFICVKQPWPIDMSDSEELGAKFQRWLIAFQFHDCRRQSFARPGPNYGIGASFMWQSKFFMFAIEAKKVYRPISDNWLWAEGNPNNCTLGVRSTDCYCEPLSDCGFSNFTRSPWFDKYVNDSYELTKDMFDTSGLMDVCTIGQRLKKPVKWVLAHLMAYMTRLRADIKEAIASKLENIFQHQYPGTLSLAVQMRSGNPDGGRHPASLVRFVAAADAFVADIERIHKKNVSMIYVCSELPEKTFISADHMNTHYPRSFRWVQSPVFLSLGSGEAELNFRANGGNLISHARQIMTEYFADIYALGKADFLLGSSSNVYILAATNRIITGNYYKYPNSTCYLSLYSTNDADIKRICEGQSEAKKNWEYYYGPFTHFEDF